MTCPRCGKNMVRQKGVEIYLSNPPQWDEQWWCGCGYASGWTRVRGLTKQEMLREEWGNINK